MKLPFVPVRRMEASLPRTLAPAVTYLCCALLLSACATGARSPEARPQLYPNAALTKMGDAQAKAEADSCMSKAQAAGIDPKDNNNAVGQGAVKGAAVGGVAGTVAGVITGHGIEGALKRGAAGAAVGGAAGATRGAFNEHANPTYRRFVQRCLSEKGLEVIGWN